MNHRLFSVLATNDSTLYVGTAGGINKTTDADNLYPSWTKFTHTNEEYPISGNFVVALGYNQNLNNSIWAATWQAEGTDEFYAVSYSTDGGLTWGTALDGEQAHNFGFKGNSVIAATDDGPFRSTDIGATWTLPTSIVDNETHLSISTPIFYAAGSQGLYLWLGSIDGLARLDETPGTTWGGTWKIYFASVPLTTKEDSYAYPNPFSPKLDLCKIKYSTGGKQASVTIRIFNFDMKYVRTVVQNVQRGEPIHSIDNNGTGTNGVIDFWNGKDDNGVIVPNGVYFYRVDVSGLSPVFGKIIVLQ